MITFEARLVLGTVCLAVLVLGAGNAVIVKWMHANQSDLIRVSGTVLSVFGAVLLWLMRQTHERKNDEKKSAARRDRLILALTAEIEMQLENYVEQFVGDGSEARKAALLKSVDVAQENEHSMPIGVVPKENDVFDRVKDELADLPPSVIGPIIRYYQADEYVVEMIKAFTAGIFEKKDKAKRKVVIAAYFEQGKDAARLGCDALLSMSEYLHRDPPAITRQFASLSKSNDDDGR